jgi:hypothetical protein
MADNLIRYGFRFISGPCNPIEKFIAASTSFDVSGGASNVALRAGDVVVLAADGGVDLCNGSETTTQAPYGVVAHVDFYYNATTGQMEHASAIPSDVDYSTNLERQTKVVVIPFSRDQVWEVDCDDAATFTTKATYQAAVNLNVDFINKGASGELAASPRLDISSAATTSTLMFNILQIAPTKENQDFSGNYVKLYVRPNHIQLQEAGVAGV